MSKVNMRNLVFILIVIISEAGCSKLEVSPLDSASTACIQFYGDANGEVLKSFGRTPDGGFYFGGYTYTSASNAAQGFIRKTDSLGKTLWYHEYGGPYDDSFRTVGIVSDGGFIAAGATTSFGEGIFPNNYFPDAYLTKISANGDVIWQKGFGLPSYDRFDEVKETPDHGFVAVGRVADHKTTSLPYEPRVFILRTDADGNELWRREAFINSYSYGTDVAFLPSGDIAVAAGRQKSSVVTETAKYDPSLTVVSENGHFSRGEVYYDNWGTWNINSTYPCVKILSADDGIIFGANLNDANYSVMLFKVDFTGQILWNRQFFGLGNASLNKIEYSKTGNIYISGNTTDAKGTSNYWFLETDASGNKLKEISIPVKGYALSAQGVIPQGNHWAAGLSLQSGILKHKTYYGLLFTDNNGKIIENEK